MVIRIAIVILLWLCSATIAIAEEGRWYDIEVIFFAHLDNDNANFEKWDSSLQMQLDPAALELFDANTAKPLSVDQALDVNKRLETLITNPVSSILANNDLILKKQAKKIDRYHATKVILHTGWRQLFTDASAVKLHIFGGKDYSDSFNLSGFRKSSSANVDGKESIQVHPWDVESVFEETLEPTRLHLWQLDGFIEINLAHYMHIDTDFVIRTPIKDYIAMPSANPATEGESKRINQAIKDVLKSKSGVKTVERLKQFNLKQAHKLKSHDLHYVDHPLLGIMLSIRPYKPGTDLDQRLGISQQ